MIRRFLLWLTARMRVKVIGRPGQPYVEWYHVCTVLGLLRVQIHHFVRSDPDGLHDHPWGWACSLILAGPYLEQRRDRDRARRSGTAYLLNGDTFHRVVLIDGRDVWTLFVHGPYKKHWGFLTPYSAGGHPAKRGPLGERHLVEPSWHDKAGATWIYRARPRDDSGFSRWPWKPATPRGRDIRASSGRA